MCHQCYSSNNNTDVATNYVSTHPTKTFLIAGAVVIGTVALYDYFSSDPDATAKDLDMQRSRTTKTITKKIGQFMYTMLWPVSKWVTDSGSKNECNCDGDCEK